MSGRRSFAGVGVVGHFVGVQHVGPVVDFDIAVQFVLSPVFSCWSAQMVVEAASCCSACAEQGVLEGPAAFSECRLVEKNPCGFEFIVESGTQLAGYYRGHGKLMTKKQRRDKESSAENHRQKINDNRWKMAVHRRRADLQFACLVAAA